MIHAITPQQASSWKRLPLLLSDGRLIDLLNLTQIWYCWWKKSSTSSNLDMQNHVVYIMGHLQYQVVIAGFLPPTVSPNNFGKPMVNTPWSSPVIHFLFTMETRDLIQGNHSWLYIHILFVYIYIYCRVRGMYQRVVHSPTFYPSRWTLIGAPRRLPISGHEIPESLPRTVANRCWEAWFFYR